MFSQITKLCSSALIIAGREKIVKLLSLFTSFISILPRFQPHCGNRKRRSLYDAHNSTDMELLNRVPRLDVTGTDDVMALSTHAIRVFDKPRLPTKTRVRPEGQCPTVRADISTIAVDDVVIALGLKHVVDWLK